MGRMKVGFSFVLVLLAVSAQAQDSVQERILGVFYPYRQGPPQVAGITPGMRIDKGNWQVASPALPSEVLTYLQAGDFAITVQETTDMPLREEYINATLEHHAGVELGEGELKNYVAGMPFPLIDPQDPRAGEKAAWNFRYRDRGETLQYWPTINVQNSSGSVERSISFYAAFMYGMHRLHPNDNHWEREGILHKQYSRMFAPMDQEGTQVLSYRKDKDTEADEEWVYDPKTRRVRKVVYNPYEASSGMDFLVEDRSGFNGYVHPYTWRYLGERVVLAPGVTRAEGPHFGGRGGWYPVDPWELRRAVVLEAVPKEEHSYSRRVLYLDLQTYWILYGFAYDRNTTHHRTTFLVYRHSDYDQWNEGVRLPLHVGESWVDYRAGRGAVFLSPKVVFNQPLKEQLFKTGALMRHGK